MKWAQGDKNQNVETLQEFFWGPFYIVQIYQMFFDGKLSDQLSTQLKTKKFKVAFKLVFAVIFYADAISVKVLSCE